jgi:hypothetical protein
MRIAKPILIVATPLGVLAGLWEAYRVAGGLVFLMLALVLVIAAGFTHVVLTVRRESRADRANAHESHHPARPPTNRPAGRAGT